MSAPSASQSETAFGTNQSEPRARKSDRQDLNPETSSAWSGLVKDRIKSQLEPELDEDPNNIRLCGLHRCKIGNANATGSKLNLQQFLHLRALVKRHVDQDFPLNEYVEAKYVKAADDILRKWHDFDHYISHVHRHDPALDVDNFGLFAGAKLVQNQVLLDAYLHTPQDEADSFQESVTETPLKKVRPGVRPGIKLDVKPPDKDAADEQIVNEALISFASALTRRWMVQKTPADVYDTNQTPTKGGGAVPTHDWKTVADWTMTRDRFHIKERIRHDDQIQNGHMRALKANTRREGKQLEADGHSYGHVMTCETDGSLYCIDADTTEILAIVEAKRRLRRNNQLKIERQEAAEILSWLNLRLRSESVQHGNEGKDPLTPRRGMLKATGESQGKSRCLLVAQDREEIYLVIGEWDILYEQYALEGKFSDTDLQMLKQLNSTSGPAGSDAGFLTLHVYGPYGGVGKGPLSQSETMRKLSTNLLALSLHLSQASDPTAYRGISPAASNQLHARRGTGRPCCAGCTCDCRCGKTPTGTPGASRSHSESSETRKGGREDSCGGSKPSEPSTKRTASHSSQDSGTQDTTPTRNQGSGPRRPDEGRAASIRDQSAPRAVQAQAHDNLPLQGRRAAVDPQGSSSEAHAQPGRSKSRGRDAAATGHHGQPQTTTTTMPPPPPMPQAAGPPGPVPGQQQPYQSQRPPRRQAAQGMQPRRDPQYTPVRSGTQQHGAAAFTQTHPHMARPQVSGQMADNIQHPQHDPLHGPGPSYQTQAGPSSFSTPSGAAVPPDARDPSQPQPQPDETPVKKKDKKSTPINSIISFGKKKDKGDKK